MLKNNIIYYSIVNKKNIKIADTSQNNETKQAQIVLKRMLDYFNLKMPEIEVSKDGKPFFKGSKIFFNYSHSKKYIACAISLTEVGIDIEETDRIISDRVAEKYLDGEKNFLKRIEKWVKKESYSKLKGLGIQINFQNIKLEEIKENNHFIKQKDYMCSIYSNEKSMAFQELKL